MAKIIKAIRKGKPEKRTDNFKERFKSLILFGIVQKRVARDKYAGILHIFIFWGFVVLSISIIETIARGYFPDFVFPLLGLNNYLYFFQDIFIFLVIIGVIMGLYRRLVVKPEKLEEGMKDALVILVLIFFVVVTLKGYNATRVVMDSYPPDALWMPLSLIGAKFFGFVGMSAGAAILWHKIFWWGHVVVLLLFLAYVPHSKHLHMIMGIFNVYFRDLKPKGHVQSIDIEKSEKFGASQIEDLSWRHLLDGHACTECGRCKDSCPAYQTGKKELNPKMLIMNVREHTLHNGKPIIGNVISEEGLWHCTSCRACMEECPVFVEHVPKILDMRRHLVLMEGRFPEEAQKACRNLEVNFNPWGLGSDSRADWAEGIDVKTMADKGQADVLLWVGCLASFDDRNKKVARALANILEKANVDFAILGNEEKCNGDFARRMGNEYLAQILITENIKTLSKYKFKKILTLCPHCFNTLKHDYPSFGAKFEVVHVAQFLNNLLKSRQLKLVSGKGLKMTYHDPCYLGRYNDIYDEPREILENIGELKEMARSSDKSFCCGAGGGRMFMEEKVGKKINVVRTQEAVKTKTGTICTACPFCLTMISDGLKAEDIEDVKAMDICELIADRTQ